MPAMCEAPFLSNIISRKTYPQYPKRFRVAIDGVEIEIIIQASALLCKLWILLNFQVRSIRVMFKIESSIFFDTTRTLGIRPPEHPKSSH